MKRFATILLAFVLVSALFTPALAAEENTQVIAVQETALENGITVVDEILESAQSRSTDKSYTRKRSFYDGDTLIAVIAFDAVFRYDGSTVSVVSKSVTQTDTYDSWNYSQTSFTSSGGTVTLSGKLTKWLVFNNSFSMGMTCDANGNISFS